MGDGLQTAAEIRHRRSRLIPGIGKAHRIGEVTIPEQDSEVPAFDLHPVGLVEVLVPPPVVQGAREDPFVGGSPTEAQFRENRNQLGTHRAFGGPEPQRTPAEEPLVKAKRLPELGFRILRMRKPMRQGGIGPRPASRVGVDQQRQDRMEERRRGELDLPAVLQPSVQRDDPGNDVALARQHGLLVGLRELPSLGRQLPEDGVLRQGPMAEPGEIVPYLQIQQVLGGEPAGQVGEVLIARVRATLEQQTVVPVVRTDHRVPVGAEEVAQDEDTFVAAQVRRRTRCVHPEQIRDRTVRQLLELEQERGGQVHRDSHIRVLVQQ